MLLNLLIQALQWFCRDAERVVATGDMFMCFGDRCLVPDVFVVRDAERRWRRNLGMATDGAPEFVIELVSRNTLADDLGDKFRLCRDTLRVREYFVFDPEGGEIEPRLQGWRLVEGA